MYPSTNGMLLCELICFQPENLEFYAVKKQLNSSVGFQVYSRKQICEDICSFSDLRFTRHDTSFYIISLMAAIYSHLISVYFYMFFFSHLDHQFLGFFFIHMRGKGFVVIIGSLLHIFSLYLCLDYKLIFFCFYINLFI